MRKAASAGVAFLGGFVLMVLEVVGARYLLRDFGGSFYVWISQIGVIMVALSVGYLAGGAFIDRTGRIAAVAWMQIPVGVFTGLIPDFSPVVLQWIVMRHPLDREIPPLWQKLDPAVGSLLIFLWPCLALSMLSPCMVRLSTEGLSHVGRASGLISSITAAGSIAGVVLAGYVLLDHLSISRIFRIAGGLIVLLGAACLLLDRKAKAAE